MAKTKVITFVVRGVYGFPFDMLRYDQAWSTSNGASALSRVSRGENREYDNDPTKSEESHLGRLVPVEIELQTHAGRVTDDRWVSFGWRVIDQRVSSF